MIRLRRTTPRDDTGLYVIGSGGASRRCRWIGPTLLLLALAVAVWAHWPSLGLGFASDDFQWWQAARFAIDEPLRLVLPYGGYRPANLWILAGEHLLFGAQPQGYHVTSLLLHLGCGVVLWLLLTRLRFSAGARFAVVLLWLCSPYTLEPAQSVCVRFQPLLMLGWTGMALAWPRAHQSWTRGRLATVATLSLLTAMSKESWVVLPGFVVVFEVFLRQQAPRRALRVAALACLGPLIYTVVYFLNPPIGSSYFGSLSEGLIKIPHSWAVFTGLTQLRPVDLRFGLAEALACVAMAAAAWVGWRWRRPVVAVGMAFFVLPFIPIAAVSFMATRYTMIPFAGFLIVIADLARAAGERLEGRSRTLLVAATTLVCGVYLLAQLAWLAGDMSDARARDQAHRRLLAEVRAVAPQLPRDRILVAVRAEHENPILELALGVRGVPKIYYPRHQDPYGLIDWAALLSWVLDEEGGPLYQKVESGSLPDATGPDFAEILHTSGGFTLRPGSAAGISETVRTWEERGFRVTVLRPRGS